MELLNLHDDSIYLLFENLDVQSQYNLACVCKRFQQIFKSFAKIAFRRVNFRILNAVPRNNENHFVKLVDSSGAIGVEIVENVLQYCTNLEAVRLDYGNNWPMKYFENLSKMNSVKTIYVYASHNKKKTLHRLTAALKYLPNLKHLSLNTLQYVGRNINHLYGLKTLELNIDHPLKPEHFITHCMRLQNLERLELEEYTTCHFTSETFEAMADHCKNLEMLLLTIYTYNVEYEKVAKLPRLKYFILNCLQLRPEMIEALVKYKSNELILLKISSLEIGVQMVAGIGKLTALRELHCWPVNNECFKHLCNLKNLEILNLQFTTITNDILLMLLTALDKLRLVDLYQCIYITPNVIPSILALLKERAFLNRGVLRYPLELCVRQTNIRLDNLENPELVKAKHLLRLNMQRKTNYSLKFEGIFDYCY